MGLEKIEWDKLTAKEQLSIRELLAPTKPSQRWFGIDRFGIVNIDGVIHKYDETTDSFVRIDKVKPFDTSEENIVAGREVNFNPINDYTPPENFLEFPNLVAGSSKAQPISDFTFIGKNEIGDLKTAKFVTPTKNLMMQFDDDEPILINEFTGREISFVLTDNDNSSFIFEKDGKKFKLFVK